VLRDLRILFGWLLLFSLAVLAGCNQQTGAVDGEAERPATPELKKAKLTALGDSLTEGLGVDPEMAYPAQLEARLQAEGLSWVVVNAGLSGETSSGARTRLGWVLKTEPDAVLLVTGANDGLRGLDPALTEENLDAIVTELKAKNIKVMLGGMKAPPNLGADYATKFELLYQRVAQKHSVPLIPFLLEGVARDPKLNQKDGKHPTAEGYTKVVDHIFEDVKSWLEG
jgi:acyl-CoA thioesterase I